MKLIHKNKGVLTPAGKEYRALGNRVVDVYADSQGKKHELDGTEQPLDEMVKEADTSIIKDAEIEKEGKLQELSDDMEFQKNLDEYDEKEAEKEEKSLRHKELLEKVENASESVVEAIKGIPETVIPDHTKEYKAWKEEILSALQIDIPEVDLGPVIKAINSIKIPETKIPVPQDYSKLLKEIKSALPKDTDLSGVIKAINNIPQFPELKFNKRGQLMVEVDRVGMGGGGGTINGATETKQDLTNSKLDTLHSDLDGVEGKLDSIVTNTTGLGGTLKDYILQEPDDYTTTNVTYLGKMKTNGTWLMVKIDETGNFPTFRYANVSNNPTLTTYALAWAARTTATYNYLNILTI